MRLQGVGGPPDPSGGRAGLAMAAEAGDAAAATDLGLLHRDGGAGLAPRPTRAADWFARAAEAGDGWGAYHLARMLSDGDEAVPDDPERALSLLSLADARGIGTATHRLALAYWDGIGTQVDHLAARAAMERAAALGLPEALNDLGVMVETGVGALPDPGAAPALYEASARAGYVLGGWNLADLLLNDGIAPVDRAEGYAWCLWAMSHETDEALLQGYRESCAAHAAGLAPDERAEAAARFRALPPPGATPPEAAP
jgi:TPR repeat protein